MNDKDYGDLMDYETGDMIRKATREELKASIKAAEGDGGPGVITVDAIPVGTRCYVEGDESLLEDTPDPITNLAGLYEAMKAGDPRTLDHHGQWSTDLPTFGLAPGVYRMGIWSWDDTHVIKGGSAADLEIVRRGFE